MLNSLLDSAPRTEPLIRVYSQYITFNAPAAKLLGFKDDDVVSIMQDDRDGYVYVANCQAKQSYTLASRNNTYLVRNSLLSRKLAECLDGFGTYRISKDMIQTDLFGNKYYNIFKKKYGETKSNSVQRNIQDSI